MNFDELDKMGIDDSFTLPMPSLEDVMDWYSIERQEMGPVLAEWQRRYPQYADALAEFDALLNISARMPEPPISPEEEMRLAESAIRVANKVLHERRNG